MKHRRLAPTLLLAALAIALQGACGSSGAAACDRVKTYCSVSDAKDKDCRDGLVVAQGKGCESQLADFLNCLMDNGSKCNTAGELDDDVAACSGQKNTLETCTK